LNENLKILPAFAVMVRAVAAIADKVLPKRREKWPE
jgi:hypothetical protein